MTVKNDSRTFIEMANSLLSSGYCFRFRAEGTSMRPTIRHGETLTVEPVDLETVDPGDILLYRHGDRPVAHRVVEIRRKQTPVEFVLRGDAKAACDAPVAADHVMGRVRVPESRGWLSCLFRRSV